MASRQRRNFAASAASYVGLLAILSLCGCSPVSDALSGQRTTEGFEAYVKQKPIGNGGDYWIQMRNAAGEWERVGLIFGFYTAEGTKLECENAIAGLKKVNFEREYVCMPANIP